jgi:hypothetical protein
LSRICGVWTRLVAFKDMPDDVLLDLWLSVGLVALGQNWSCLGSCVWAGLIVFVQD